MPTRLNSTVGNSRRQSPTVKSRWRRRCELAVTDLSLIFSALMLLINPFVTLFEFLFQSVTQYKRFFCLLAYLMLVRSTCQVCLKGVHFTVGQHVGLHECHLCLGKNIGNRITYRYADFHERWKMLDQAHISMQIGVYFLL